MDFGGGTGADLGWLTKNMYEVCFCEPSKAMRDIAIELNNKEIKSERIQFLKETQTDFIQWNSNTFPNNFDAILADFCVFNTIDDINLLFSKLNTILNPGGQIIATLLDTTFKGIIKYHIKSFVRAFITMGYPTMLVQHSVNRHTVYLHTPGKLMQAIPGEFSCKKIESLGKSGFMLVHFEKSEHGK